MSFLNNLTSTSATAIAVGPAGNANPSFQVDCSTASAVTGVKLKSAALAGGAALSVVSSGVNENLTTDAKGTGTITLNGIATGAVISGGPFKIATGKTFSILDNGTAAATAGAATLNQSAGVITSEALVTAFGADYVLTLTNSQVAAADLVFASVNNGTNTTEGLAVNRVTPAAGSVAIRIRNTNAATALNGTIKISFQVVKVT